METIVRLEKVRFIGRSSAEGIILRFFQRWLGAQTSVVDLSVPVCRVCASWLLKQPDRSLGILGGTDPGTTNREFLTFFFRFSMLFLGESSNLESYYFSEASKYNFLSKCSTRGYHIFTKICILKPPRSSSFRGLKSHQENLENIEQC